MKNGFIRPRGNKWYYSFEGASIKGKRVRIEHVGGDTQEEAWAALRQAINDYENAGIPSKLERMSVADYFEYWMTNYVKKNLKDNTIMNYANIIKKYINPHIGHYHMKDVSPAALQKMIDDISEETNDITKRPLAKHTVEIILTVTKEAFKKAVFPYQIIRQNPADYVEMPRYAPQQNRSRQDMKIISIEQYQQILDQTPVASPFYLPLIIAFNTGMRRGEVLGLTWEHVNLEDGTIEVCQQMIQLGKGNVKIETPKSRAGFRMITIGQSLVKELRHAKLIQAKNKLRYGEFYTDNDFVTVKEDGSFVLPSFIKSKCMALQTKLGFPFSFHSLRHTHATMLLEAGEKEKIVQERLGHSKISTTLDTYTHVTRQMQNSTATMFEELLAKKGLS